MSNKERKLNSKSWIDHAILKKIKERDSLLNIYHKTANGMQKNDLFNKYKVLRNEVTKMKRSAKESYYKDYFPKNRLKT